MLVSNFSLAFSFRFYEYLWLRNKGADLENMFQGLPISLQADISLSLYKEIIESVSYSYTHFGTLSRDKFTSLKLLT